MVDTTELVEAVGLMGTLTLIIFTWISIAESPWFGITARRHWVGLLRRRSTAFGEFYINLAPGGLRQTSDRLKWLDIAIQLAVVTALFVLMFGSLFGQLPVAAWVFGILAMIGWMALSRFIVDLLTRSEARLAKFAKIADPKVWTGAEKRLAVGFTIVSRHPEFSFLLAVTSPIGVLFSFAENPYSMVQQLYGALYLVEAFFFGIYWTWYLLDAEREIESRLFRAFVKFRPGFRVLADVFYAGDGCVVENGQVRDIGEDLRLRDARGGVLELRWKRVDLIVPHDPPSPTLDSWSGVA